MQLSSRAFAQQEQTLGSLMPQGGKNLEKND